MKCLHPIWIKQEKVLVPCGKCVFCKIARSKDWSVRIMHETHYHLHNIFLTLTYDEEHLPIDGGLIKDELSNFIKRLRKYTNQKIRYYGCGEYGEVNGRPHYHVIIFGMNEKSFELQPYQLHNSKTGKWENCYKHKAWKKGDIHIGNVEYDSARYVADYCQKTYYGEMIEEIYGNLQQPYARFSKGLGKQWAIDNEKYLKQKLGCTINGREVGINKYYRNILEIEGSEMQVENRRRKLNEKLTNEEIMERSLITKLTMETSRGTDLKVELDKIYQQRELNHKKSLNLRRKK